VSLSNKVAPANHTQKQELSGLVNSIVEHAPNAILTIDKIGIIHSFNPMAEKLFGYTAVEVLGRNIKMLMPEPWRSKHDKYLRHYQKTGKSTIIGKPGRELLAMSKDNKQVPIELRVAEITVADKQYFLGFIHDITERKERDKQLEYLSTHDPVTNLINPGQLLVVMNEMLGKHQPFLLFYLELDRFQAINEVLGHTTGDQVLANVGQQLETLLGKNAHVARISGSSFALLWPSEAKGFGKAMDMAKCIHTSLEEPLKLDEFSVDVEASIGIVCSLGHEHHAEDLLRCAQIAMQAARDRQIIFAVYDEEMESHQIANLTLVSELRHAIKHNELVIYYQPKINIAERKVVGVEALVRWIHPERGFTPPDLFIPTAEETNIIHPFTEWLIGETSRQIKTWQDKGIELVISINLAPNNLLEADLPERLERAIKSQNIKPANFMMEITERGFIADPERAMATLGRIHELGLPISIDDFGTGYSSLSYLKDMPLEELKIDQSFIRSINEDAGSLTIVHMVIQMAHFLGFEVTAEGVELADDWSRLELMGCDRAQGYFMGKPMPVDEFERWLKESPWHL